MVVFVTPSCPYSFELLQALVRHAEAGQGRTEILIASLAGDGRSLQTWIEHLQSDGASVTYMIQPRAAGRRIALDAVPMLFRYVDGTLVEVHAGRDWPPELENAEG
ncbi:MAG TPA: hypothetical protein VMM17_09175 [Gemmatimonadaceae bacterium]|nr:hypothetical protein [Gemmatimonadaceae bacterium]